MFLGYNLSLLTPFTVPDTVFIAIHATICSVAPATLPRVCVFEIKLSVGCGGAFSFLMLFMGKIALYDGDFLGFFAFVCFLMYDFVKSQAFIRV